MTQRPEPTPHELPPRERLAMTRRDIVHFMRQETRHRPTTEHSSNSRDDAAPHAAAQPDEEDGRGADDVGSTWQTLKRTLSAWWQAHPARLAVEVAEPLLQKYAEKHPLKLLAIGAGAGVAIVLARPWRLVSLTGLAVAALKSSQLSAMAASWIKSKDQP